MRGDELSRKEIGCFTDNLDILYDSIIHHVVGFKIIESFVRRISNHALSGCNMCSSRSLSLSGSLINQNFIAINTLTGKRGKRTICNQVYITTKQGFQILIHAEEF